MSKPINVPTGQDSLITITGSTLLRHVAGAVEQATAELRAEREALLADAERYAYVLANARRIDICRVSLVDTNMDQLSARIDAALKEAK